MKQIFVIGGIVVLAVATAVVGFRLSTDALSIIVGAFLGMAAIIPTLFLGGYLLKKNQEVTPGPAAGYQQPPVVVVSGGMMPAQYFQPPQQQAASTMPALMPPPTASAPRKFHLMGYEETERMELSDDDWAKLN